MGEIERVVGVTAQLVPDMQGESMAQALLEFKSGRVGYFEAMAGEDLHLGPGGRQGWRIVGSHGEITITGFRDELTGRAILIASHCLMQSTRKGSAAARVRPQQAQATQRHSGSRYSTSRKLQAPGAHVLATPPTAG